MAIRAYEIERLLQRMGLYDVDGVSGPVRTKLANCLDGVFDAVQTAGHFYQDRGRVSVPQRPPLPPTFINMSTYRNSSTGVVDVAALRSAIVAAGGVATIYVPPISGGSHKINTKLNLYSGTAGTTWNITFVGDAGSIALTGSMIFLDGAEAWIDCKGSVVRFFNIRIEGDDALAAAVWSRDSTLKSINFSGMFECQINGSFVNPPIVMYGSELFSLRDTQIRRVNQGPVVSFDPSLLAGTFGSSGDGTSNTSSGITVDGCIITSGDGSTELVKIGSTTTDVIFRGCWFALEDNVDYSCPRIIGLYGYALQPSRQCVPRRIIIDSCTTELSSLIGYSDADSQSHEVWVEAMDNRVVLGEVDFIGVGSSKWKARVK